MVDPWESILTDGVVPTLRVESEASLRRRRKRDRLFALVTWGELARLLPILSKADFAVWLQLRTLQRVKGAEAWIVAYPEVLKSWGVPTRSYRRALANLAKAGLLEANPQPGRKTRVRLKPVLAEPRGSDDDVLEL